MTARESEVRNCLFAFFCAQKLPFFFSRLSLAFFSAPMFFPPRRAYIFCFFPRLFLALFSAATCFFLLFSAAICAACAAPRCRESGAMLAPKKSVFIVEGNKVHRAKETAQTGYFWRKKQNKVLEKRRKKALELVYILRLAGIVHIPSYTFTGAGVILTRTFTEAGAASMYE